MSLSRRPISMAVALLLPSLFLLLWTYSPTAFAEPACGPIQNVSGNQSGTWTAGRVYVLTGNVFVPPGTTLVIEPGAVIKAPLATSIYILGTLTANGTVGQPIYFSSVSDDALCGDTNGDGASSLPGPRNWGFIEFQADSNPTSSLSRAVVRYGGRGDFFGGGTVVSDHGTVRLRGVVPALANLTLEQNYRNAVELEGSSWPSATLSSTSVIYWLGSNVNVLAGQTFTILPGVKIKAPATASLYVSGRLIANGAAPTDSSPAIPITFTSEQDDTVCGAGASNEPVCDTNGDGASSTPGPRNWGFIEFQADSDPTSSLSRAVVRYGGRGDFFGGGTVVSDHGTVRLRGVVPALTNLTLEQNYRNAVELEGGSWPSARLSSTSVIYWLGSNVNVLAGQTFTILPGVKIKTPAITSLYVSGKLTADGTAPTGSSPAVPITFTSERDDTVCGIGASDEPVCDTNGDGTSSAPAPGDWGFIEFQVGSDPTSSLSRAVVRYGGRGDFFGGGTVVNNHGAVRLRNVSPTISYNRLQENFIGVEIDGGATPTLTCNDFIQNQAFGMRNNQPATTASARGQWWNSATGPTNASNPGGRGEAVTSGVDFLGWAQGPCNFQDRPAEVPPVSWRVLLPLIRK